MNEADRLKLAIIAAIAVVAVLIAVIAATLPPAAPPDEGETTRAVSEAKYGIRVGGALTNASTALTDYLDAIDLWQPSVNDEIVAAMLDSPIDEMNKSLGRLTVAPAVCSAYEQTHAMMVDALGKYLVAFELTKTAVQEVNPGALDGIADIVEDANAVLLFAQTIYIDLWVGPPNC